MKNIKTSKIMLGLFTVISLFAINSLVISVSAQEGKKEKCRAMANQVYFVDSGQTVTEVKPGPNGGNGYQLNILGTGVDNFEVVQERFMTSLGVIPNYTNATSAKWGLTFAANMGRVIRSIRLKNKCTGETDSYKLVSEIQLLDQENGKCVAFAKNIYFVDSGTVVSEVHPGPNGGNGYQLNILGTGVDNFEVIQERFMTSVGVIPNYTNATSAKWGLTFAAKVGRVIQSVRMKNKCTGETKDYKLDSAVKLLDQ